MTVVIFDKGGRRLGFERRQFSYLSHIPERRSGKDRRSGEDRRHEPGTELDKEKERRGIFKK
jgi:hypothetical protein